MAYSGVLDDVKTAVSLGIPERIPIFAISEPFDVRMSGLTYAEYTHDADKMARCRIEAVKTFDYDWSCGWPDDYVEYEPLGVKLKGEENIPLAAYEYPEASFNTLKRLKIPDSRRDGRMPGFLEVLKRIKKEFGNTVCLTGRVAAPFSGVGLLYGVQEALILPMENPDLLRKTMEFVSELAIYWGKEQIKAGADALWVGDCVASSGFISPKYYAEFALEPAHKVIMTLRKENVFLFYHAGENSLSHLKLMAETKPNALSIGGKIDIKKAKETFSKKNCLLGNMRGIEVMKYGTREDVEKETSRIMEEGKRGGGYIFNSEEGIPPDVPIENMKVMLETARRHSF